jgi:MFS family permease
MATESGQRASWLLKAVIILSAPAQMAIYAVPTPLLSMMSAEFHGPMDDYMLKMILGVAGPAMIAGAAIGGLLTDMGGRRPTMIGAALLFGLAGAAPFMLHSLPLILATRIAAAGAAAALATIGQAMVGDHFDEAHRPSWMGALAAVTQVSGFLCFPLSGALGAIGWRWPFLIYLVGVLLAGLALAGMPRKAPTPRKARALKTPKPKAAPGVVNYPIGLFLLAFMTGPIFNLPAIYLSFYLHKFPAIDLSFNLHKFSLQTSAMTGGILAMSALVASIISANYGWARRRMSFRRLFAVGFTAGACGLVMLALAPNIWFVAGAMAFTGFATGWVNPNVYTAVIDSVDAHHRGRAMGITHASSALGPAVGVTLLQPFVLHLGYSGVYLLMASVAGAVALAVITLGIGRRRVASMAAA